MGKHLDEATVVFTVLHNEGQIGQGTKVSAQNSKTGPEIRVQITCLRLV